VRPGDIVTISDQLSEVECPCFGGWKDASLNAIKSDTFISSVFSSTGIFIVIAVTELQFVHTKFHESILISDGKAALWVLDEHVKKCW
jgi:hypothetical protein